MLKAYSKFEKNGRRENDTLTWIFLETLHACGSSSSKSPHHSLSFNSYHDSPRHHSHSSSSMSSSSTRLPSSSSSWSNSSATSLKSHFHKGPKLIENETSHFIDCDGDPYDFDFEIEFYYFCIQYLDDTSPSFEDEKAYYRAWLKIQYYSNLSSKNSNAENRDFSLKEDHVSVEPLSCGGSLPSSTSSNTHTSLKISKSSTNPSSNKGPNDFHAVPYSYPQGLPLEETQGKLHLIANTSNN